MDDIHNKTMEELLSDLNHFKLENNHLRNLIDNLIVENQYNKERLVNNGISDNKFKGLGFWSWQNEKMIWSSEIYQILGQATDYDPSSTNGFEFYTDKSRNLIEQAFHCLIERGEPFSLDLEVKTKRGESLWIQKTGSAKFVDDKIFSLAGSFQDITLRKIKELSLFEDKKHLQYLLNETNDYYFRLKITSDGNILMNYISDKYSLVRGNKIEEVANPSEWNKFVHPDDLDLVYQSLLKIIKTKDKLSFECRSQFNSDLRYVEISAVPIISSESDQIYFIYGTVKDITSKKQAEYALKMSEDNLKKAQYLGNVGHWQYEINNNKIRFSEQCLRIFELPLEQNILDRNILESMFHPEDRQEINEKFTRALIEKSDFEVEHRIITAANKLKYVIGRISLKFDEDRNVIGSIGSITDISDRKEAEIRIKQQNEELFQLNSTRNKFFSIIAHDLKSPFSSILGLSDLMVDKIDVYDIEKLKPLIKSLNHSANQTYKLLENLLIWSRMQTGRLKPNIEKAKIGTLVDDVCQLLEETARIKNILIENSVFSNLIVDCDIHMTNAILRNLINNAIKFTKIGGKISIESVKKKDYVEIVVKDNGVGIEADLIPNLFNLGQNRITRGTANENGSGLGLSLCKELVEKQGGTLNVKSKVGEGSSFIFTLLCM